MIDLTQLAQGAVTGATNTVSTSTRPKNSALDWFKVLGNTATGIFGGPQNVSLVADRNNLPGGFNSGGFGGGGGRPLNVGRIIAISVVIIIVVALIILAVKKKK